MTAPKKRKPFVSGQGQTGATPNMAETKAQETTDRVTASLIAFLEQDIAHDPQKIRPLDTKLAKRINKLTKGIAVSLEEDLGDGMSLLTMEQLLARAKELKDR
jgi:hypothetical protein